MTLSGAKRGAMAVCCWAWLVAGAGAAAAQQGKAHGGQIDGTPLDTLMNTHFHSEVPEAKDFVRESRPPPETLQYQPTYGVDPERPKLRTAAELKAMEGDLETAAARNRGRAGRAAKPSPAK